MDRAAHVERDTARHGEVLQLRPKAATVKRSQSYRRALAEQILTLPRGFISKEFSPVLLLRGIYLLKT
jgi:DNA mismatch repair protein MutH